MTKKELQDALRAKGIAFSATASNAELQALLDGASVQTMFAIGDDLLKIISDKGGVAFDSDELKDQLRKDKESEYPDFGRTIPEGIYTLVGYATVHAWRSRRGNVSNIRTAYLAETDKDGNPYELPFACLSKGAYEFIPLNEDKFVPKTVLPHFESVADRNFAVASLQAGTKIRVRHSYGHHDNPYAKRVFDFTYTWAELA